MANPEHTPELDGFDQITVAAYRVGLALATVGVAWTGARLWRGWDVGVAGWLLWAGVVLSVGHLHLYDKRVRWAIAWMAWGGLLLAAAGGWVGDDLRPWTTLAAHGLVLAALSGLVLKEWFCFRIPGVRLVPVALAGAVLAQAMGRGDVAGPLLVASSIGIAAVAAAKARMPLGHDIGDRSRYQI